MVGILQHLYQSGNFRAFRQVWSRRIFGGLVGVNFRKKISKKFSKKSPVEVRWKSGGSPVEVRWKSVGSPVKVWWKSGGSLMREIARGLMRGLARGFARGNINHESCYWLGLGLKCLVRLGLGLTCPDMLG